MRIPSARPYIPEGDLIEWQNRLTRIVESGRLILGEYTERFEAAAGLTFGMSTVSLSSATAGLEIALRFAGVRNSLVGVCANTFIAVPNAVRRAGGIPLFIDMKASTWGMDDSLALGRLRSLSALIVSPIAGQVDPWHERLVKTAQSQGVFVIEDISHAHGARLNGRLLGTFGNVGVASLYATKIITAGTGGMLMSYNAELIEYARSMRHHGARHGSDLSQIEHAHAGDYLMPESSAALADLQLARIEDFLRTRRSIADQYLVNLRRLAPIVEPAMIYGGCEPAWYKFPVGFATSPLRDAVRAALRDAGVDSGPLYEPAVYRWMRVSDHCVTAEQYLPRQLCLPVHVRMLPSDVTHVCGVIRDVVERRGDDDAASA